MLMFCIGITYIIVKLIFNILFSLNFKFTALFYFISLNEHIIEKEKRETAIDFKLPMPENNFFLIISMCKYRCAKGRFFSDLALV